MTWRRQAATTIAAPEANDGTTAEDAVTSAVRAAARLGLVGAWQPGLDETGMTVIWVRMVTTVAARCGAELTPATAAKLVTAALAGCAAYSTGSKIFSWSLVAVFHVVPGAGIPAATALNAALNAMFTHRLGRLCIARFSDPRFTARDLMDLGRLLVTVPSWSELNEIRQVLVGS